MAEPSGRPKSDGQPDRSSPALKRIVVADLVRLAITIIALLAGIFIAERPCPVLLVETLTSGDTPARATERIGFQLFDESGTIVSMPTGSSATAIGTVTIHITWMTRGLVDRPLIVRGVVSHVTIDTEKEETRQTLLAHVKSNAVSLPFGMPLKRWNVAHAGAIDFAKADGSRAEWVCTAGTSEVLRQSPLPIQFLVLAAIGAGLWLMRPRSVNAWWRVSKNQCIHCAYPWDGLASLCAECGRPPR
ncbi:MAG TPA: hypothetical protein VD971_00120 [Phycisphaerales bacterium]|nr:hypothetical protein [Phycisphaerales bacterium]